jgi:hypothetical protein
MTTSAETTQEVGQANRGSNAGASPDGHAEPAHAPRRNRSKEAVDPIDELAQETKRVTLLEREEQQLKDRQHCSRVLFVFGIVDERKTQSMVEQEFIAWRNQQEGSKDVTGLLLFLGQAAVSFLEGPTEILFKAVELFHGLTTEVVAAPVLPLPPADMRANVPAAKAEGAVPAPSPRLALISMVKVLYFTELHGVRTSVGWSSFVSPAKLTTGGGATESNVEELVFALYKKMLVLCMKVKDAAGGETNSDQLQGHYRKQTEIMPLPDEVVLLLSKQVADSFFSFAEFQKVFMKPFQLVLNSELLWPMAPALSY